MKRCLFIVDVYGWAWEFMTRGIIKNLPSGWIGETVDLTEALSKAWWSYDGVWFWNPNLLYLTIIRDGYSVHGDIPDYPSGLDRKKISILQRTNMIIGFYGSERIKERIDWITNLNVKVAFICNKYYDLATKLYPNYNRFNVVHPAADIEMFYPNRKPHDEFTVGWAGHANWTYKRTYLLDKIKLPIKRKSDWGIQFFYKNRPFGKDMADFYNSLDAYICVSKQEGIPQTILESAACGLPILSTDVGGISDFLDSEFLCPAYPEKEVVKFMNKYLAEWKANPELAREIGKRNLQKINKYWNWKRTAEDIVRIWENRGDTC